MGERFFVFRNERIEYTVEFKKRKTVGISISESGSVKISSPPWVTNKQLQQIVDRKAEWIYKKLKQLTLRNETKNENKDEIFYLGDKYKLTLIKDNLVKKPLVVLSGSDFIIHVPSIINDTNFDEYIKSIVLNWYREKSYSIFSERVVYYSKIMNVKPVRIAVKNQKTRWGSCSSKGNINLNQKLVMFPLAIVDYVIVHEMTHLRIMNHSKDFWRAVETVLPDYKNRIKTLKEYKEMI